MEKGQLMQELLEKGVSKEAISFIGAILPKGESLPTQALDAIKGHAFDHTNSDPYEALGLNKGYVAEAVGKYLEFAQSDSEDKELCTMSGYVEHIIDTLEDDYNLKLFVTMCGVEKLREIVNDNPILGARKALQDGQFDPAKLLEVVADMLSKSNNPKKSKLYDIDDSIY